MTGSMLMVSLVAAVSTGVTCAADAWTAPRLGQVKVLGRPGERMSAALDSRVFSDYARTVVYDEAENAFRTHADDNDVNACGWQNEYWGKTMLTVAGAVAYTGDRELRSWALTKAHAFIDAFQKPNGYLSTYQHEDLVGGPDQRSIFNVWGRKYTFWALIELYRVTGDVRCLDAAEKMADHLVAQLRRLGKTIDKTGIWHGISSASILKPLLLLNAIRPKPEYLALASECFTAYDVENGPVPNLVRNAFRKDVICSWYPKATYWAKAYEIMSCIEGWIELYRVTGNERALAAAKAFHGHLMAEELNPMRSVGYFDHFLNARQHVNGMSELCDVTHWIRMNRELFLVTGEARYLDCIEEAFYNAFLAGVQPDGAWGAHIVRSHGTRHMSAPAQTGMRYHQCCPDNMIRTFFDWAQTSVVRDASGDFAVCLYSDACVSFPDAQVTIAGDYPMSDDPVRVTVRTDKPRRVRFRLPGWSPAVIVNGESRSAEDGWCAVEAAAGESTLLLKFDMTPRIVDSPRPNLEDIPPSPQMPGSDIGAYTVFFFEWGAPEMANFCRREPSAQVMRGPVVLAKGRLAGTSREETLAFETVNRLGYRAELLPARRTCANVSAWGAWTLVLSRNGERRLIPVADFASVSAVNDAANWFSLWF